MKLRILTVGRRHETNVAELVAKYEQRLKQFAEIEWVYIAPASYEQQVPTIKDESERIIKLIKPNETVILLDERGREYDNRGFAEMIQMQTNRGRSNFVFVIGGAFGVSENLRQRADSIWSLSPLVFPHQLVRIILIEQLYRTFSLLANHPYHH